MLSNEKIITYRFEFRYFAKKPRRYSPLIVMDIGTQGKILQVSLLQ